MATKLTKKRALELTRDMWRWLSKNPGKRKHEWTGWKANGGNVEYMIYSCACCEFALKQPHRNGKACQNCPILSAWKQSPMNINAPCCDPGSPYNAWVPGGATAARNAKIIADAAVDELRKLSRKAKK